MDWTELITVASLADLREKDITACENQGELIERILKWMGSVVGTKAQEPYQIEREVVAWMAHYWGLEVSKDEDTGQIERRIRVAIAEESGKHLMPFWEVGCAMAYIGPEDAVGPKLELMETAASRLVPSQSARNELRKAWETNRKGEGASWQAVLDALSGHIEKLKKDRDMVEPTLVLSLVVALADGRFGLEEDQFYEQLGRRLEAPHMLVQDLKKRINGLFWEKQLEVSPSARTDDPESRETKLAALKAAHLTLETTGVLRTLESEVQSGFLGQLHKNMTKDPAFEKGVESWNKTPLLWPVGYAAGMCLYFKSKLRASDRPDLIKVAYLAICRQHLGATPDKGKLDDSVVAKDKHVDKDTADKMLAEAAVEKVKQQEIRPIKLN